MGDAFTLAQSDTPALPIAHLGDRNPKNRRPGNRGGQRWLAAARCPLPKYATTGQRGQWAAGMHAQPTIAHCPRMQPVGNGRWAKKLCACNRPQPTQKMQAFFLRAMGNGRWATIFVAHCPLPIAQYASSLMSLSMWVSKKRKKGNLLLMLKNFHAKNKEPESPKQKDYKK